MEYFSESPALIKQLLDAWYVKNFKSRELFPMEAVIEKLKLQSLMKSKIKPIKFVRNPTTLSG